MSRDRKYSRILSAAKYYSAIDNYIKYITDASKRGSNVGQGKPRPKSKKYFLDPFSFSLATGQVVPVSASETAFNDLKGFMSGRFQEKEDDGEKIIKVAGFTATRVIVTTGRSTSGTPKTSAVTGMKYLDYGGKSESVAFGRKDETEEQADAANEVKAAVTLGKSGALVTVRPEKYSV